MDKDSKNIDKFIQENLDVKKTSLDFTNEVMEQVFRLELKEEKAMTSFFQKHILEEPSSEFTSKVMSGLPQNSPTFVYQPVIGKKAWYFITAVFITLVIYIFFNLDPNSTQIVDFSTYLERIETVFSFEIPGILTSPFFALSMFALSSLLLIDYFIRNRQYS